MTSSLTPFAFDDSLVRVRTDDAGNPWFVAKDVCNVLDLGNPSQAVSDLEDDEKNTISIADGNRGNPNMLIISESGLYSLVFRSRKPEARRFRKWVTAEVLPELRKTGSYQAGSGPASASLEDLHELVATWAMLAELPRQALLTQIYAQFGLTREEPPAGAVLDAARYVLARNADLLRKGRSVGLKAVRQYEAFTKGEEEEPALVTAFWQQFDLLNAEGGPEGQKPGWLNHSRSPALMAVNLPQFLRASQARGLYVFDAPELRRLLRASTPRKLVESNKAMYSAHTGKALKCWVFYLAPGPCPLMNLSSDTDDARPESQTEEADV
ncbi:prophage antirepressor [Desulfovibrio sp. X2]|uniref:BRO-N domain-containing protein n=1 Tax=Desulfovibrio sp. X2 TaxID=941449 RepID=UPI000358C039|nr:Bro-N domain-containing protein [Desulfovibrio sp. X2]EPR43120.1 prophage antirepressor [Desulfovibrio sp. X2]